MSKKIIKKEESVKVNILKSRFEFKTGKCNLEFTVNFKTGDIILEGSGNFFAPLQNGVGIQRHIDFIECYEVAMQHIKKQLYLFTLSEEK